MKRSVIILFIMIFSLSFLGCKASKSAWHAIKLPTIQLPSIKFPSMKLPHLFGKHHAKKKQAQDDYDAETANLAALAYPSEVAFSDLDIIAIQQKKYLKLINNTAMRYQDVQIWINQQYVAIVKLVDVNANNKVRLTRFINRHGEAYPVAKFLAPDKSFPVKLVEIFDPQTKQRYRLLVQNTLPY